MDHKARKAALVEYLKAKIAEEDWHGVSDAANDLRVHEAKCEHKFLVESGIRVSETEINGKSFIEVSRK